MQAKTAHDPRILAIDLRPQRFSYAVFGGPKRLLDTGACFYPPGGDKGAIPAARKVGVLLKAFLPSVIVVRKVRDETTRNSPGVRPILKAIRREASLRSIPVHLIARKDVREAFRIFRGTTKYEIACILTEMFPELVWKLPPKRKTWQCEHPGMSIFDAVALGFMCWQSNGIQIPPPE